MNKLKDKVAVITGGSGGLGSAMVKALAEAGAKVAVLGRKLENSEQVVREIEKSGGQGLAVVGDVMSLDSLKEAHQRVLDELGPTDILVNGAGGNKPKATAAPGTSFFELEPGAVQEVMALNFHGTFLTCQVFAKDMVETGSGSIINISSMAAVRPLTRVVAYAAAKAAVDNFTQWLSVYMAHNHSRDIRVNAIAPGFFLTEQNHYLLIDAESGGMTERGQKIIDHTPMGRLGAPDDLLGALLWLAGPESKFVTGIIVPVDGGFSAYGGV